MTRPARPPLYMTDGEIASAIGAQVGKSYDALQFNETRAVRISGTPIPAMTGRSFDTYALSEHAFDSIPLISVDTSSLPCPGDLREWYSERAKWDAFDSCYFAWGQTTGLVKIGFTKKRRSRTAVYASDSAEAIEFFWMPGNLAIEALLLTTSRPYRIRGSWHHPHPILINYMHKCEIMAFIEDGDDDPKHKATWHLE